MSQSSGPSAGAGRPGLVTQDGVGEVLHLRAADGAEARIAAHGAHILGWKTPDGSERLFLSKTAQFGGTAAIRGGVPVIFPQFAGEGPLPKHGFVRNRPWQLIDARQPAAGPATARFRIEDDAASRALWPHAFRAELGVRIVGTSIEIDLAVANTGGDAFRFTAALHSYLHVDDLDAARVEGLQGLHYRDSAAAGRVSVESAATLAIAGEVDRIYLDAPAALELVELSRRLRIESSSFADAVVWNPGEAKAGGFADLEAGGWQRFLCIESAAIGRPIELKAGGHWQGSQRLIAG